MYHLEKEVEADGNHIPFVSINRSKSLFHMKAVFRKFQALACIKHFQMFLSCRLSSAPHASVTSASILFLQSCPLHKTGLSGHSCYYFLAYTQLSELYFAHVSEEFQINLNKHAGHVQVTVWINRTSRGLSKSVEIICKLKNTERVKFSVLLFTVCSGGERITYCALACSLSRETSPEIWKLGEIGAASENAFVSRPFDTRSTRKECTEGGS